MDIANAALWSPLPTDLFDSDEASAYQFLKRGDGVFDESGCAETCSQ